MVRGFSRIPSGTLIFSDLDLKNPYKSALRSIRVNPRTILIKTTSANNCNYEEH